MRIGTSQDEPAGPDALSRLRDQLQRAADDGFASAWISNIFGLDALTALAVAGSQVPGIELGTAVVPTYPRHPAVLAQQALTAATALGGRLTLGIGLSHQIVIEDMYGYSFDRPARHMREYLSILLPLLDGQPASFEGETMRAQIGLSTPRPGRVPVLLAALAPQMLRLAGAARRRHRAVDDRPGHRTGLHRPGDQRQQPRPRGGRARAWSACCRSASPTTRTAPGPARTGSSRSTGSCRPTGRCSTGRAPRGPATSYSTGDEDAVAAQIGALEEAGVTDFVAVEYSRGEDQVRTRALLKSLVS